MIVEVEVKGVEWRWKWRNVRGGRDRGWEQRGIEGKSEKNQKQKGSQLEARAVALKVTCPICKVQLANQNQLGDHYASKHPKEKPPSESG